MPFYDASEVERNEIAPGVTIRTMWGDRVMMSLVETAPNAVVPNHNHPHEQAGIMVQGEFEMTIGGETRLLRAGDAYVIPGGVEHSVKCGDGLGARAGHLLSAPRGLHGRRRKAQPDRPRLTRALDTGPLSSGAQAGRLVLAPGATD